MSLEEIVDDPDTRAFFFAFQTRDGFIGTMEFGKEELSYDDVIDFAGSHVASVVVEVDGEPKEIMKDILREAKKRKFYETPEVNKNGIQRNP